MTRAPDAAFYRLKMAAKDLIDRAGGIERSGRIAGYSKSHVARWQAADCHDMIPLLAVVALEAETRAPLVTHALSGLYAGDEEQSCRQPLNQSFAAIEQAATQLAADMGEVMGQGLVTPNEQRRLGDEAAAIEKALDRFRASLVGLKCAVAKVGE